MELKCIKGSVGLPVDLEDVERVLQYQELPYVLEIIRSKIISCHHSDFVVEHFGINKTIKLVSQKYYWSSLEKDIETYVWGCNVGLTSKAIHHNSYGDLQSLLVPIYW